MDIEKAVAATSRLTVVIVSMTMAAVALVAVGLVLGPVIVEPEAREGLEVLLWIVLALPLLELGVLAQLWMLQTKRMQSIEEPIKRLPMYRARLIVTAALLEGPALLAAVAILLLGFRWQVIPALVIFALGMAALVPTPGRVRAAIGLPAMKQDKYS